MCAEPSALDGAIHTLAVALAQRHRLGVHDALIVAAALAAGWDTVYTEDMQHGRAFEGRLILDNPFAGP